MEVKEIKDKENWEKFLEECYPKTFLQSWNWGEFSKKMGQKIWRLGVYKNDQLLATCLAVKVKAKRGTFLMVEHGPNIIPNLKHQSSKLKILEILLEKLKEIAKKEGASFIRVCPIWERTEENKEVFRKLGFREAPIHLHPEISWILDLDKTEEELLYGMRKTTRYLIRQAQKNLEIKITKSQALKDLEIFYQIYQKTAKRQRFVPFSYDFLKNQLEVFREDNQILIFLGEYQKEVLSGAIIVYWQNGAFYHHGASLRKYSKIPISYLIQWEAIREAKKRGCDFYSFWGIAPPKKNHPWQGLTLFKKGFGGREEAYLQTQDYLLSYKYFVNFLVEKIRKIKRGY